jgi:hypothetical protein
MIVSEIDDNRYETRKIEIWRNGKSGYALHGNEFNGCALGITPIPEIDDINNDPQFRMWMIDKIDFERFWVQFVK